MCGRPLRRRWAPSSITPNEKLGWLAAAAGSMVLGQSQCSARVLIGNERLGSAMEARNKVMQGARAAEGPRKVREEGCSASGFVSRLRRQYGAMRLRQAAILWVCIG